MEAVVVVSASTWPMPELKMKHVVNQMINHHMPVMKQTMPDKPITLALVLVCLPPLIVSNSESRRIFLPAMSIHEHQQLQTTCYMYCVLGCLKPFSTFDTPLSRPIKVPHELCLLPFVLVCENRWHNVSQVAPCAQQLVDGSLPVGKSGKAHSAASPPAHI